MVRKSVSNARREGGSQLHIKERVLLGLAKQGMLVPARHGYLLGRKRIAAAVVEALRDDGLIRPLAAGRFSLTDDGVARVRRLRVLSRAGGTGKASSRFINGDAVEQVAFKAQHQIREEMKKGAAQPCVTINRTESPLGWLKQRRDKQGRAYLSEDQFEAGEKFRLDFELAGMSPRVTAAWSGTPVDKGRKAYRPSDPTTVQIAARQRFLKALDALGEELSGVVLRTCCFLEGLESVERREGWPVRSGKVVLSLALERLVRHYGMKSGQGAKGKGALSRMKQEY